MMSLDEISDKTGNKSYSEMTMYCEDEDKGQRESIMKAFREHPNRVDDIAKAQLLLFELGNINELLLLQFLPHSWYNRWDNNQCARFGVDTLSEFFNSDFVHKEVLEKHPNIRYILLLDMPRAIRLEDSSRFIRITLSNAARTDPTYRNDHHAVTFPPPIPIYKERNWTVPVEHDPYLLVFQGACLGYPEPKLRQYMRTMNKLTSIHDVELRCVGKDDIVQWHLEEGHVPDDEQTFELVIDDPGGSYVQLMENTKFALDMPGWDPWTYRFTEAMRFNDIVVRIEDEDQQWIFPLIPSHCGLEPNIARVSCDSAAQNG